jgi:hypothetical protein
MSNDANSSINPSQTVLKIAPIILLTVILAGCSSPKSSSTPKEKPAKSSASRKAEKPATAKQNKNLIAAKVSSAHDAEVKEILQLAETDKWEEAETKAEALTKKDPQDFSVARMTAWVRHDRLGAATAATPARCRAGKTHSRD